MAYGIVALPTIPHFDESASDADVSACLVTLTVLAKSTCIKHGRKSRNIGRHKTRSDGKFCVGGELSRLGRN